MPYSDPPIFTNGNILTAGQLNTLSADIEYINSLTDYVNIPTSTYKYGIGNDQSMSEAFWVFRHRHRYLHYYLALETDSVDANLHIDVNWGTGDGNEWTTVKIISTNLTAPYFHVGYADLTKDYLDADLSIPLNARMQVRWDTVCRGLATNYYFLESSFTSI